MLNVQPDGFDLQPLKNQIRKFFEWEFSPDGECKSRELSGSGPWTFHTFENAKAKGKGKGKGKPKDTDMEEEEEKDEDED